MTCEDCGAEMPCRAICDDCIEAYTASDNSDKAELRRERDEALDEKALLRVANANLLAELRQATERAEKAEAERDEARREAVMVLSAEIFGGALEALSCLSPAGVLSSGLDRWITGDLDEDEEGPAEFLDEAEALSAGRALPWWEVAQ